MPMTRASLVLLNSIIGVAATAILLIHIIWRTEPWAHYASAALLIVGLLAIGLLYRPGAPGFFPGYGSLSPKWRRIGIGVLVLLAAYPWTLALALGIRSRLLPDNVITRAVLLGGIAAFVIIGLNIAIRGFLERS